MKKTIIAAAIATVAAAPAMADVSVSGQVKVTIADIEGSAGDWKPSYENQVWFKANEDLGNGLSAFAQIGLDTDSMTDNTKDQKVGVKGGFGTIVAGRMETLTEGQVSSMMDDGAHVHAQDKQLESAYTVVGRKNAVAYISPAMNGLTIGAAGVLNGSTTGDDGDGLFQSTDIMLAYANGPLTVKAAFANLDGADTAAVTGVADVGATSQGTTAVAAASGNDTDVVSVAASYSFGDAKVSAMTVESETEGSASVRDNMYRLDYKMGNNSILVGMKDAELGTNDMNVIKLTHKMSKRTAVWVGHRDKDTAGDVTHMGIIHKF